ncbi:hypothetical protein K3U93_00130 [Mycobacterium malmoense]|uniref:Uncharacterized protein n=1 Tax=Mycobacterium malmoense TaxID=1780 RepID=A0ABX3SZZ5_MYCMA|nr:hypothetical protein [Mycobacterium malmoense]ORA85355.1 hypothetical protein BST29_00305 [Mycobacterium malmoense]QZA17714.1 hypothetical protein K3U93_00130 [Mycobacterium malmoense]UNB94495.1 hypothetical protein H5T25_00130 [Mycobacterium malmoense]
MKTLLEFFLQYFDFLYLDPRYRITDSKTSGSQTINASLTLTGPLISWDLFNDRGQMGFAIAPTQLAESPDNWFRLSLVRQYLDDYDETNFVSPPATVAWVRDNLGRIEELFSDAKAARSCEELLTLAKSLANKYFGPPKA